MKFYYILFFGIVLISCSVSSSGRKANLFKECAQNYKNDFAEVTLEKYVGILENDTLLNTQIKFQCTSSALYNLRTMYGYYGRWHKSIIPINEPKPLLVWENIDLFSNGKNFTIMTFGEEIARNDISTSVMVFDKEGKDVINEDTELRKKIVEFFGSNIRKNKNKSEKFYHEYLKEFIPEYWEKYKTFNKID